MTLEVLDRIQRKVLWLSTYMVHNANFLRPGGDGTKVGGHQASSASVVSLMTALYFKALRPGDVVAVKAHASPAFYAIQYLRGRLDVEALAGLRTFGGLQAYPSRRKNPQIVDLSTGSMGLGAVAATFAALGARYVADHGGPRRPERFIVMVGDAELDEGNVWEALLEEVVAQLSNVLWIVDVNRQSLDRIVPDGRRQQLAALFATAGWRVLELRWGSRLRSLFARPRGGLLRDRLEAMPNGEFQRMLRLPGSGVRKALVIGPGGEADPALDRLLGDVPDEALPGLVGDLGGHDLGLILEAFAEAEATTDRPCVILADTIKGWGLPIAADPLNHTALLSPGQLETVREALGVAPGAEWESFAAGSAEACLIGALPPLFASPPPPPAPAIPDTVDESYTGALSTQEAFGRVLGTLGRLPAGGALVTVSADVALTTHLAGWITRKGVYFPRERPDFFGEGPRPVQWKESPAGQHIELGIAEHNLFLLLGALGLAPELSGASLLPIGTLYDPFVTRGLDALYHALYAGGRFIVAATPSGVTLAPEGGAHQSVITPGMGVALPGARYFEPTFGCEVEWILLDGLRRLGDRAAGESLYLRLSTRPIDQAIAPAASVEQRARVLRGGYRLRDARHAPGYDRDRAVHIFATGVMVPDAVQASRRLEAGDVCASVFVVTSPDLLYRDVRDGGRPYLLDLVGADEEDVPVVSVLDGHSHALAFIGGALGVTQTALGVDDFGESGARADLYRHHGIDAGSIARAALRLLGRLALPSDGD
jgi:pyruvate dehydrogenase E1 component